MESDGKSWCPLDDWPNVSPCPYRLDSRVVCLDKYSLQAVCLDEHSIPVWKVIEDLRWELRHYDLTIRVSHG